MCDLKPLRNHNFKRSHKIIKIQTWRRCSQFCIQCNATRILYIAPNSCGTKIRMNRAVPIESRKKNTLKSKQRDKFGGFCVYFLFRFEKKRCFASVAYLLMMIFFFLISTVTRNEYRAKCFGRFDSNICVCRTYNSHENGTSGSVSITRVTVSAKDYTIDGLWSFAHTHSHVMCILGRFTIAFSTFPSFI